MNNTNTVCSEDCFFSRTLDFLTKFLHKEMGRSVHTVNAYRRALDAFMLYIATELYIDPTKFAFKDCTSDFVLTYIQYLREKKMYSPSSINQYISSIKTYLKYVSNGNVSLMQIYLPIQRIEPQKVPKLQRPVLDEKMIEYILEKPRATLKGNRDRVLLILLFDSAIRVSELTQIKMGDVGLNVDKPYIIINGKGKKQRTVTLNERTARHLRMYVKHYHIENPNPDTPLFYTKIHNEINHMTTRNVERILQKYADEVRAEHPELNLPEKVHPHMIRRSRATGLYRDGVPLELISAALGHAQIETTKIYAIPSVEQMREALKRGKVDVDAPADKLWVGKLDEMRKMFGLK